MKNRYINSVIACVVASLIIGLIYTSYFLSYAQNASLSSDFDIRNISNETTLSPTPQEILHDIETLSTQERYDKLMDSCMQVRNRP